jgi:hypothetical protein
MTPRGSSKNRRFIGTYRLHLQGETASLEIRLQEELICVRLWAITAGYTDSFTLLYVDMFVPHRKHNCYRDSFTLLYVDDVCTSQEAQLLKG